MASHLVALFHDLLYISKCSAADNSKSTATPPQSSTFFSSSAKEEPASGSSATIAKMSHAVLTALKSLAKSTIAIRKLLASWLARICLIKEDDFKSVSTKSTSPSRRSLSKSKSLRDFSKEVEMLLSRDIDHEALLRLSSGLQRQFRAALKHDLSCMLPSYNHQLPHGYESGSFLALDVGGSTFRVALVQLLGPTEGTKIIAQDSYRITKAVKGLVGLKFFDWMAEKIESTLKDQKPCGDGSRLQTGLAWSFPVEQVSLEVGLIQGMGKGFLAAQGLLGQDLGAVLTLACTRRHLPISIAAIVNDSTATLLAGAYSTPSTAFSLILGTGVNIAVHLPTSSMSPIKFGRREPAWHTNAKHVLVNTELGMFGKEGILPLCRWDEELNRGHEHPGFQPLEHLVSGRYLGEVLRLVLLEGARDAGIFGGVIPDSLEEQYSLDTEILSLMEGADTIEEARREFFKSHPAAAMLSDEEVSVIRDIASHISRRAAGIIAASLHGLWQLRQDANAHLPTDLTTQRTTMSSSSSSSTSSLSSSTTATEAKTAVACNGSVIQSYPGFRQNCQAFLNELVEASGGCEGALVLEMTHESSLVGAAVAVAC